MALTNLGKTGLNNREQTVISKLFSGGTNPNGVLTSAAGSIYMETTTPEIYVNVDSGNTWVKLLNLPELQVDDPAYDTLQKITTILKALQTQVNTLEVEDIQNLEDYIANLDITSIDGLTSALDTKVDKVTGYALSENDFNDTYKANVDGNTAHKTATNNPHGVTKAQVGLSAVDNTSDADKPLSDAAIAALDNKVDKGGVVETVQGISPDGTGAVTLPFSDLLTDNDSTLFASARSVYRLKQMMDTIYAMDTWISALKVVGVSYKVDLANNETDLTGEVWDADIILRQINSEIRILVKTVGSGIPTLIIDQLTNTGSYYQISLISSDTDPVEPEGISLDATVAFKSNPISTTGLDTDYLQFKVDETVSAFFTLLTTETDAEDIVLFNMVGKDNSEGSFVSVASDFSIIPNDHNRYTEVTHANPTITVTGTSLTAEGDQTVIDFTGTGTLTIASSGATLRYNALRALTAEQYSVITIKKIGPSEYRVYGELNLA
ncbi:tail protein [Maribacter phage Colly_1]|uniref:Tail protein n=1 Tax=Maribacter phage Colly_1 TaxID=2745691 RepID=A0A8E4UY25_9CAUD|nr:tail protein [Maribacter phage Colly_1]QQO97341.1 tail protein [Maribacter phage Colly_1]